MTELQTAIGKAWESLLLSGGELWSVWILLQVLIILAAYVAAAVKSRRIEPRIEARLRQIAGQPLLVRVMVLVLRRLKWLIFAVLLWAVALALGEMTWPSRSYFVRLAAYLVTSWVLISLFARLIRNRSLARVVAMIAWIIAALVITGYLETVTTALDAAGVDFGGARLSLLLVVKGLGLLVILLWLAAVVGEVAEQRLSVVGLEPAISVLLGKAIKGILIVVACFLALQAVGIDATALTVFSGAFGLGIAFGLQKVASNLISGFIILMDRSIKPGDVISVGDTFGWITSLRARYVSVSTREGVEYLIPNERSSPSVSSTCRSPTARSGSMCALA